MTKKGYQPMWVDGREVGTGLRNCGSRYQAMADFLWKIDIAPGFKVLEIGAYNGYFCRRLAEDFGAHCIAVDDSPRLEEYPGVKCIHEQLTPTQIRNLGHFDVTICMSVIHHYANWQDYLTALLASGDVVFIETASPQEAFGTWQQQYAAGAHQVIAALGEILTQTPTMTGTHTRPLWAVSQ